MLDSGALAALADGVYLLPVCSPSRTLLEVRDLSVSYATRGGTRVILEALNCEVHSGEVVGLQGRSGCGKTSAALAILGLLPYGAIARGEVLFRGNDLLKLKESELRKIRGREASIIYQEPALALSPVMRVGDQIAKVLRAHSALDWQGCQQQARQVLNQVKLGADRHYRAYPHELSGGECHRVVLAQALICRPALVIADEPTTGLDVSLKNEILDLIAILRRETGAAFLVISHDRAVTDRLADRTISLPFSNGNETGMSISVPAAAKQGFSPPQATPLIAVRNLSKCYQPRGLFQTRSASKQALHSVNLSIPRGSLTALVGPSASGKSTLARCMALLEEADAGEIVFEDKNLLCLPLQQLRAFRPRLQYVSQDPAAALNPRMSAAEVIAEPLVIQNRSSRSDRRRRAELLMEQTGLDPSFADRSCHEFSGGQKQRLVIARALVLEPSLLIFDESLSGLDPQTQEEILGLLLSLRRKLGITQLLISHDMELVSKVAERVLIMRAGNIVEEHEAAEICNMNARATEHFVDAQTRQSLALSEVK